jgi:hypothetical protein
MERLSVLEGKFNEVLERLDVPVLESGKVGMYLKESSMNRWKGLDVLGGKFNEKMTGKVGCTCLKVGLMTI